MLINTKSINQYINIARQFNSSNQEKAKETKISLEREHSNNTTVYMNKRKHETFYCKDKSRSFNKKFEMFFFFLKKLKKKKKIIKKN